MLRRTIYSTILTAEVVLIALVLVDWRQHRQNWPPTEQTSRLTSPVS